MPQYQISNIYEIQRKKRKAEKDSFKTNDLQGLVLSLNIHYKTEKWTDLTK